MVDLPPSDDHGSDGDHGRDSAADDGPSTPRWVKGFGIAAVLLVVLFVVLHLVRGGFRGHGP